VSVYFKKQLVIEASQKQSGIGLLFKRGDGVVKFSALAELAEAGMKKVAVPIPSTDFDLMQDGVSAGSILYIETDTEILVKLDDTADTGFTVKPVSASRGDLADAPGTMYLEGSFSHVYVTIAGTSGEANLVVAILGE
jgi:hypothetical protein